MITQRVFVEMLGEVVHSRGSLIGNRMDLRGRLITPRDEAFARIHTAGKGDIGKTDGTRVALEVDYLPGEPPVLSRYDTLNPDFVDEVIEANIWGEYYCSESKDRYGEKRKLADTEANQEIPFPERTAITLPSYNFHMTLKINYEVLEFILQDLGRSYFEKNNKVPINFYPLDKKVVDGSQPSKLTNLNGTIVVPFLWFRSLKDNSELSGDNSVAHYIGMARGLSDTRA